MLTEEHPHSLLLFSVWPRDDEELFKHLLEKEGDVEHNYFDYLDFVSKACERVIDKKMLRRTFCVSISQKNATRMRVCLATGVIPDRSMNYDSIILDVSGIGIDLPYIITTNDFYCVVRDQYRKLVKYRFNSLFPRVYDQNSDFPVSELSLNLESGEVMSNFLSADKDDELIPLKFMKYFSELIGYLNYRIQRVSEIEITSISEYVYYCILISWSKNEGVTFMNNRILLQFMNLIFRSQVNRYYKKKSRALSEGIVGVIQQFESVMFDHGCQKCFLDRMYDCIETKEGKIGISTLMTDMSDIFSDMIELVPNPCDHTGWNGSCFFTKKDIRPNEMKLYMTGLSPVMDIVNTGINNFIKKERLDFSNVIITISDKTQEVSCQDLITGFNFILKEGWWSGRLSHKYIGPLITLYGYAQIAFFILRCERFSVKRRAFPNMNTVWGMRTPFFTMNREGKSFFDAIKRDNRTNNHRLFRVSNAIFTILDSEVERKRLSRIDLVNERIDDPSSSNGIRDLINFFSFIDSFLDKRKSSKDRQHIQQEGRSVMLYSELV